jgi:hypothetical protein
MFVLPTGPEILDFDNPEWSRQILLQLRMNSPDVAHGRLAEVTRAFIGPHLGPTLPPSGPSTKAMLENLEKQGFCRWSRTISAYRQRFPISCPGSRRATETKHATLNSFMLTPTTSNG